MPTNSMGPAEEAQHAIRRSTRLPLEIPLLVTSLDPKKPFSEQCNTTLVNAHGCGLIAPRAIAQDVQVRLDMVSAKRHTTARVREVVPLGGDNETWLLGLELDVPGNFWGIDYAPSDWKIEEVVAPGAVEPIHKPPAAEAKPVPKRRWCLTDISAGACYLETAIPLPAASEVLLSFRVAEKEYLLEGIVRVSHAEIGMGVEFTAAPEHDSRAQVEEFIGHLKSSREVPKIFVGKREIRTHRKDDPHPANNPPPGAAPNDELLDPLLLLIRQAPSLAPEQFLNDLRAQRLGKRRDPRIDLALQVLLTGTDVGGRPLNQRVVTINISRRGALMEGIHGMLKLGDKISLSRLHHTEQFQVAWVGEEGTPAAGQIGVAAVDPNTTFWSEVLETMVQSRIDTASGHDHDR